MIGAIIGDIVGSRFEFNNHLSKEFDFFHPNCEFTDDTVMTCAVAHVLRFHTPAVPMAGRVFSITQQKSDSSMISIPPA